MTYIKKLKEWDNHKWLKNNLAIIFDENLKYEMEDYILIYDKKLGLFKRIYYLCKGLFH